MTPKVVILIYLFIYQINLADLECYKKFNELREKAERILSGGGKLEHIEQTTKEGRIKRLGKIKDDISNIIANREKLGGSRFEQSAFVLSVIDLIGYRVYKNRKLKLDPCTHTTTKIWQDNSESDDWNLYYLGLTSKPYNRTIAMQNVIYANVINSKNKNLRERQFFSAVNATTIDKGLDDLMLGLKAPNFVAMRASALFEKILRENINIPGKKSKYLYYSHTFRKVKEQSPVTNTTFKTLIV